MTDRDKQIEALLKETKSALEFSIENDSDGHELALVSLNKVLALLKPCETCGGSGKPCTSCGEYHPIISMCPLQVDICPDCGRKSDCTDKPPCKTCIHWTLKEGH